jgi:hypothetical protein
MHAPSQGRVDSKLKVILLNLGSSGTEIFAQRTGETPLHPWRISVRQTQTFAP